MGGIPNTLVFLKVQYTVNFFVHVCVCHVHEYQDMHTCCVCMCVCICMYICSWRSEIDAKDLSQSLLHFHILRQRSLKLECTSWLDWPDREFWFILSLPRQHWKPPLTFFSHRRWGPKGRSSQFQFTCGLSPSPLGLGSPLESECVLEGSSVFQAPE